MNALEVALKGNAEVCRYYLGYFLYVRFMYGNCYSIYLLIKLNKAAAEGALYEIG